VMSSPPETVIRPKLHTIEMFSTLTHEDVPKVGMQGACFLVPEATHAHSLVSAAIPSENDTPSV
jgi:hypothetical protein